MFNIIIYFIYKHYNNKCFLITIIMINFNIWTRNKRKKKSYYVKFSYALHGLPTNIFSNMKFEIEL